MHASDPTKRALVLVAEDEDRLRELTVELLAAHGFDAIAARHGGEALSLFTAHAEQIDAVLLDLSMPVMDGARVLGEMRRRRPRLPALLTSGYDEQHSTLEYEGEQVGFLQKPYRAENLVARLRALLAEN